MKHYTIALGDGHRVGVSEAGEGTPFVFLHGWGANRKMYATMYEALAEQGYRVIALDMAGHGDTDALPVGHHFIEVVDLVARALHTLGVREAVVAGHSMGGRVAATYAATFPEYAQVVVLLDAATGAEFDERARTLRGLSPMAIARFAVGALTDVVGDFRGASGSTRRAAAGGAFGTAKGIARSARGIASFGLAALAAPSVEALECLRDDRVPTVIIHGELDRIVPWASAVSSANLSGARLYQVLGAHHAWMLADGKAAADMIRVALERTVRGVA